METLRRLRVAGGEAALNGARDALRAPQGQQELEGGGARGEAGGEGDPEGLPNSCLYTLHPNPSVNIMKSDGKRMETSFRCVFSIVNGFQHGARSQWIPAAVPCSWAKPRTC